MKNIQVLPVVVGITLCTASAALFYKWYKTKRRDEVDGSRVRPKRQAKKNVNVELTIPNDKVPLVIGRSGANVRDMESRHSVKVTFRQKDDAHQLCEIAGHYEDVMKAVDSVKDKLVQAVNVTENIIIPKSLCVKMSNRGGKTLQEISQQSFTKIHIDSGASDKNTRCLSITGSHANVQKAKYLIEEKVRQEREEQELELKREPRYSPKSSTSTSMENLKNLPKQSSPQPPSLPTNYETLKNTEGQFEIYVSAIASPARFWVQMVGPQIAKLERLIEEMTDYYEQVENQALHRIENAYLGQIVAAKFNFDGKWYRAEIVGIEPNITNPRNVALDVYFLDYGDSMYVLPNEVFEMRTDFLTLRYQAIECFLANLQPAYPVENDRWNHSAINRFEEITHVAKWKKLIAKIVTTKERFRGGDLNQPEGSPIPGIELYDLVDDREVNLATTLILENFAVPANHVGTETPLQRYSSSENVLRLDGGTTNYGGSVAEKAMMFELTANLQSNGAGTSPNSKMNGSLNGQRSPVKTPRKNRKKGEKENNGNVQNLSHSTETNNAQRNLLGNRSWAEIMEAEADHTT